MSACIENARTAHHTARALLSVWSGGHQHRGMIRIQPNKGGVWGQCQS